MGGEDTRRHGPRTDETVTRSADLVRRLDSVIESRRVRLEQADATIDKVHQLLEVVPAPPDPTSTEVAR